MTSLRSLRSSILALLVVVVPSCSLASIQIGYPIAEQRVNGSPLGGLLGGTPLLQIPLDVDLAAETAARNTGPARHVYLSAFSLGITSTSEPAGDTDDFDFIESIDVFIEGREGSSLPRVRIAHLDAVPRGARALSLDVEDVDIIEYVQEGARITASASGSLPPDDVTYDGDLEFAVHVL